MSTDTEQGDGRAAAKHGSDALGAPVEKMPPLCVVIC